MRCGRLPHNGNKIFLSAVRYTRGLHALLHRNCNMSACHVLGSRGLDEKNPRLRQMSVNVFVSRDGFGDLRCRPSEEGMNNEHLQLKQPRPPGP